MKTDCGNLNCHEKGTMLPTLYRSTKPVTLVTKAKTVWDLFVIACLTGKSNAKAQRSKGAKGKSFLTTDYTHKHRWALILSPPCIDRQTLSLG